MSDTQTEQADTLNKNEVFSFCRHLGRSLKNADATDALLASKLTREAEHLQKNGFSAASEMFIVVAQTLTATPDK